MRYSTKLFTEAELEGRQEVAYLTWLNEQDGATRADVREQHALEDEAIADGTAHFASDREDFRADL